MRERLGPKVATRDATFMQIGETAPAKGVPRAATRSISIADTPTDLIATFGRVVRQARSFPVAAFAAPMRKGFDSERAGLMK
jgi:hypothetical protein